MLAMASAHSYLKLAKGTCVETLTFPSPFNGLNTICAWSSSKDGHLPPVPRPPPSVSAVPPPPEDFSNSHASSAPGKIAVQIIGLLSGVIFVGALYRLAAEVALPLRFFICHSGGINQEGENFPRGYMTK